MGKKNRENRSKSVSDTSITSDVGSVDSSPSSSPDASPSSSPETARRTNEERTTFKKAVKPPKDAEGKINAAKGGIQMGSSARIIETNLMREDQQRLARQRQRLIRSRKQNVRLQAEAEKQKLILQAEVDKQKRITLAHAKEVLLVRAGLHDSLRRVGDYLKAVNDDPLFVERYPGISEFIQRFSTLLDVAAVNPFTFAVNGNPNPSLDEMKKAINEMPLNEVINRLEQGGRSEAWSDFVVTTLRMAEMYDEVNQFSTLIDGVPELNELRATYLGRMDTVSANTIGIIQKAANFQLQLKTILKELTQLKGIQDANRGNSLTGYVAVDDFIASVLPLNDMALELAAKCNELKREVDIKKQLMHDLQARSSEVKLAAKEKSKGLGEMDALVAGVLQEVKAVKPTRASAIAIEQLESGMLRLRELVKRPKVDAIALKQTLDNIALSLEGVRDAVQVASVMESQLDDNRALVLNDNFASKLVTLINELKTKLPSHAVALGGFADRLLMLRERILEKEAVSGGRRKTLSSNADNVTSGRAELINTFVMAYSQLANFKEGIAPLGEAGANDFANQFLIEVHAIISNMEMKSDRDKYGKEQALKLLDLKAYLQFLEMNGTLQSLRGLSLTIDLGALINSIVTQFAKIKDAVINDDKMIVIENSLFDNFKSLFDFITKITNENLPLSHATVDRVSKLVQTIEKQFSTMTNAINTMPEPERRPLLPSMGLFAPRAQAPVVEKSNIELLKELVENRLKLFAKPETEEQLVAKVTQQRTSTGPT